MPDAAVISDGSLSFSGGVNSVKVTTLQSEQFPDGLARNELAWLINCAVRDGGISPRGANTFLCRAHPGTAFFQGGFMYEPVDGSDPYLVCSIGGRIWKFDITTCAAEEISATRFVASTQPALNSFVTLQNNSGSTLIFTIPNGTTITAKIISGSGTPGTIITVGTLTADYVMPASGSSGKALISSPYTGAVGDVIEIQPPALPFPFTLTVVAVSAAPGPIPPPPVGPPVNPPDVEQAFFCQAEQFLVIQAGDGVTLPLFWDGANLRRSIGINNTAATPGLKGQNEIPAAFAMDYYMGRLWYAQGNQYSAGDIVGGNSGTVQYQLRDSVLNVTENPLVLGGDGFTIPAQAGNIRAIKHNASQDSSQGQGLLFIFTRKAVFSLQVPISRKDWILTGDDGGTGANAKNLMPLQTVIQDVNGAVGDRSVVAVNGDLYYQSLEPAIRSVLSAVRYFNQPGNRNISANEQRILQFCDRGLLRFVSGIEFDNRLLMSSLPKRFDNGVVSQAIIPMDFIPVSSFGVDFTPVWEGMYEGLDTLQLFTGNFGGVQRAFAFSRSSKDGGFDIWEINRSGIPLSDLNQNGENRITMSMEFPAFTWGREFLLKRVVSSEFWIDRLYGNVDFTLEFRPDGDPCWHFWTKWQACSARNCTESVYTPCDYPVEAFGQSYRASVTTARPPENCASVMGRPADLLYQCQIRLTVKGWCRIRGALLKAEPTERKLYSNNVA